MTNPLAGIFLGKITNYSQLGCAPKPIKVVVRSDGSGTTANFTAHLAAIDKVFSHTLSEPAQAIAPDLGFISLPPAVLEKGRAALATLQP